MGVMAWISEKVTALVEALTGRRQPRDSEAPRNNKSLPRGTGRPAEPAEALPFPVVTVPGASALREWERLRAEGRGWPVVVGDDKALAVLTGYYNQSRATDPAAIIAEAGTLSFPDCLGTIEDSEEPDDDALSSMPDPDAAPWPDKVNVSGISLANPGTASDLMTRAHYDRCHILILPTSQGWEVPAYLRFGGWNACPPPAVQVAALRSWHQRFGAELVGLQTDTLNLRVDRRPADRAAAMALAWEQYRYCPDLAEDAGTLTELAATLLADDWWYFWWD